MKNILIINGHQPYPFSEGKLTQSLIDSAISIFKEKGYSIKHTNVQEYNIEEDFIRFEKHLQEYF